MELHCVASIYNCSGELCPTSSPGSGSEVGNDFAEVFPQTSFPISGFGLLRQFVVSCSCLRISGFRRMGAGARVLFLVPSFQFLVSDLIHFS